MEDFEAAQILEQFDRDVAMSNVKMNVVADPAPLVCKGCDEEKQQKACPEYAGCLSDYERRRSAVVRNGSAG